MLINLRCEFQFNRNYSVKVVSTVHFLIVDFVERKPHRNFNSDRKRKYSIKVEKQNIRVVLLRY